MEVTYTPQTDQTTPPSPISGELELERRRRIAAEQECDQAKTRIQRLELERSAFFQVLGNQALQPSECIASLFTLLEVEHEQGVGHAIGPYVPVCVKAVAGRAGLSSDTTSKVVSRLAQFGAWKKPPAEECRPVQNEDTGVWTTPVVLAPAGETLLDNLRVVAQLAPSSDDRQTLTGTGKPTRREAPENRPCLP